MTSVNTLYCNLNGDVQVVVEACRKFIPSMAKGFDDKRVELIIGDGFAFMDEHINEFDVIITDSSDPEGE